MSNLREITHTSKNTSKITPYFWKVSSRKFPRMKRGNMDQISNLTYSYSSMDNHTHLTWTQS